MKYCSIFLTRTLLAISLIASLNSCRSDDDVMDPVDPMEMPADSSEQQINLPTYSFLALGDSYTIGQGLDRAENWPNQLKDKLEASDKMIDLLVIATTGWTTNNLLNAIEEEQPGPQDMVSLSIGVNNQYQGIPFSTFETEFDSLLNIAIDLGGGKENVFVVSIPDYGLTPFGSSNSETIAIELDTYNAYMELKSDEMDIPFINITEISRVLGDSENALAMDNLHPSAYQYGLWVDEIFPVTEEILE